MEYYIWKTDESESDRDFSQPNVITAAHSALKDVASALKRDILGRITAVAVTSWFVFHKQRSPSKTLNFSIIYMITYNPPVRFLFSNVMDACEYLA